MFVRTIHTSIVRRSDRIGSQSVSQIVHMSVERDQHKSKYEYINKSNEKTYTWDLRTVFSSSKISIQLFKQ